MRSRSRAFHFLPAPERRRRILSLALPIIGGMLSQNVLNLVDTAMVGSLGDTALAAVGLGSFANFTAMAFVTGMSAAVQAMAARWLGEGRAHETAQPLNGGLLLAVAIAVPWSALLFWLAPRLFPFLDDDPGVIAAGIPYWQARLVGMVAVGMNFAFRGYWNAVNLSRLYLGTLIVMHVVNISLNWVLIFGHLGAPPLGATGAGVASAIATYVGCACYFVLGVRHARGAGFLSGLPSGSTMATMLRLAIPAGLQQLFFAAGMTAFFWILAKLGTSELAAANVLINLVLVAVLPAIGFGLAAASLVGQSLGAHAAADARRWGWEVARLASLTVAVLVTPALLVPDLILGIFLHDPDTLALARMPLQIAAVGVVIDAFGLVLLNAHLGAGNSRHVMVVATALQWGLFLPLSYLVGPILGYGLLAVWAANMGYRLVQTCVFSLTWRGEAWARIKA